MSGDWEIDADLLARWRGGDLQAGEQLFARHADAVICFFRNKVSADAEDLIQETFARLVAARDRIRDGRLVRAYVLGIARRVLLEHLRKLPRQREFDPEVESIVALIPGASTIAAKRLEHRLVLEGLRRIPIEHQIILELTYWENMKANEIGAMLGVNHSTMRSRLDKARQLLEQAIAELADSPERLGSTLGELDDWATQIRAELLRRGRD